jgi:hypothetical protein
MRSTLRSGLPVARNLTASTPHNAASRCLRLTGAATLPFDCCMRCRVHLGPNSFMIFRHEPKTHFQPFSGSRLLLETGLPFIMVSRMAFEFDASGLAAWRLVNLISGELPSAEP